MTKINVSQISCWCLPAIPKREAKLHHFLFLSGFDVFSSISWMCELCLLCVTVRSLPLWDEIREESLLGFTWWEENWRQLAYIISQLGHVRLHWHAIIVYIMSLPGSSWTCPKIHTKFETVWSVSPPAAWWTTCPLNSLYRETLQNLLQWTPPLPPTLGKLLSLTAVLWCNNTTHKHLYWFGGLADIWGLEQEGK